MFKFHINFCIFQNMTYPNRMHQKGVERAAWLFLHLQSPVILNRKKTEKFTSVWMRTVLKTEIKGTLKAPNTAMHVTEGQQCLLPAFIFFNSKFLYLNVSTSTEYSFIYHRHLFVLLCSIYLNSHTVTWWHNMKHFFIRVTTREKHI